MPADIGPITPKDIQRSIILSREPHSDGMAHCERVAYILSAFRCQTIDLDEEFDYGVALGCRDDVTVCAFRELVILQSCYYESLWVYQWIDDEEREARRLHFALMLTHLDHHLAHLVAGLPTPPLYIIN